MAILVSQGWSGGLSLLFSHRSARQVCAEAKAAVETTMGVMLIGMGADLSWVDS